MGAPKGEGTIYKRGNRYHGQITIPGIGRRSFSAATKKELRQKIDEAKMLHAQGRLPSKPTKVTVAEHLLEWLEVAKPGLSYHAYEAYEISVRRRLIPGIGQLKLTDLRTEHIDRMYAKLPLAPKTIRGTHVALNQALKLAVKWNRIAFNPATDVTLPAIKTKPKTVLSAQQVALFLEAVREHRLYALWCLYVNAGLRKTEALGLKWDDVDWKDGKIRVERKLLRKTGVGLVLDDLKTEASHRTIFLGRDMMTILRSHQDRQRFERERAEREGVPWESRTEFQGLVFCTDHGSPCDPATIWRTFQGLIVGAGLPATTVHSLRDTHATSLIEAGIDPRTVAERHGHSDVATTLRNYVHVSKRMHQDAAERLEALLAAAVPSAEAQ